ncbi:hypothetical protein KR026_006753 [Drosophila bipectinata]|nr:hypothetical protein KR026_006753 [Drosophila bipectinata]
MRSFQVLLFSLGLFSLVSSQSSSLDAYILQNQRQYDAKIKSYEDQLANFRTLFAKRLEAINLQADSMQLKLEEASARLDPIALIDGWSKQCVQNYSSSIPTVTASRAALVKCTESINGVLNNVESTYNSLKSYYANNLKNALANCNKVYTKALLNYTVCVTKVIGDANQYTITNQNNFNTYLKSAECTADSKIRSSWQCAFGQVYSTTATVEVALRLVNDCIENRNVCGSNLCDTGCPVRKTVSLKEFDLRNETLQNPFRYTDQHPNCLEIRWN